MNYVTTNIRISEDDYEKYKELAVKQGRSFASLVRHALDVTYTNLKARRKRLKSLWDIDKHAIKISGLDNKESIDEVVYSRLHGRQK